MKKQIKILNLSDVIEVDIERSLDAFEELADAHNVSIQLTSFNLRSLDCCGIANWLQQKNFTTCFFPSTRTLIKSLLFYYNRVGHITKYRTGQIKTEDFVDKYLNAAIPCPKDVTPDEWRNQLIAAWNAMIQVNTEKVQKLSQYLKNNPEDSVILMTNSNEMHIDYVKNQFLEQYQTALLTVAAKEVGEHLNASRLVVVSSHLSGSFKTVRMIEEIIKSLEDGDYFDKLDKKFDHSNLEVISQYQGDLAYCQGRGLQTVSIDNEHFNYQTLSYSKFPVPESNKPNL